jgi:hypothetical protein
MKKAIVYIILLIIFSSGCKYFEKKRLFSKGVDTMLNYVAEMEENELEDTTDFYTGLGDIETESEISTDSLNNLYQENPTFNSKKFHMIVGCFLIPQNAERYSDKIKDKGYSSEIIIRNDGFHMVTANAYDNFREGVNDIPRFRSEITQQAWLYIKR